MDNTLNTDSCLGSECGTCRALELFAICDAYEAGEIDRAEFRKRVAAYRDRRREAKKG